MRLDQLRYLSDLQYSHIPFLKLPSDTSFLSNPYPTTSSS